MAAPSESMGELADKIYDARADIAASEAHTESLKASRSALENRLMALMAEQKIDSVRGERATCSIGENTRYGVSDLEAFFKLILRRKALHLLERRPAQAACAELEEQTKKPIPGLQKFTTQRLNVTKRK